MIIYFAVGFITGAILMMLMYEKFIPKGKEQKSEIKMPNVGFFS